MFTPKVREAIEYNTKFDNKLVWRFSGILVLGGILYILFLFDKLDANILFAAFIIVTSFLMWWASSEIESLHKRINILQDYISDIKIDIVDLQLHKTDKIKDLTNDKRLSTND